MDDYYSLCTSGAPNPAIAVGQLTPITARLYELIQAINSSSARLPQSSSCNQGLYHWPHEDAGIGDSRLKWQQCFFFKIQLDVLEYMLVHSVAESNEKINITSMSVH